MGFSFFAEFIYKFAGFQKVATVTTYVRTPYYYISDSLTTDRKVKVWGPEHVLNINADIMCL